MFPNFLVDVSASNLPAGYDSLGGTIVDHPDLEGNQRTNLTGAPC